MSGQDAITWNAEEATMVLVCERNPDYANTYAAWSRPVDGDDLPQVCIHDIDGGADDLTDPDTFLDWADSHLTDALTFENAGWIQAARYVRESVAGYAESVDDVAVCEVSPAIHGYYDTSDGCEPCEEGGK